MIPLENIDKKMGSTEYYSSFKLKNFINKNNIYDKYDKTYKNNTDEIIRDGENLYNKIIPKKEAIKNIEELYKIYKKDFENASWRNDFNKGDIILHKGNTFHRGCENKSNKNKKFILIFIEYNQENVSKMPDIMSKMHFFKTKTINLNNKINMYKKN